MYTIILIFYSKSTFFCTLSHNFCKSSLNSCISSCIRLWLMPNIAFSMFLIYSNKKNQKFLNRIFAYPISAISFQDYKFSWEVGHIKHHKEPLTANDPQNCPSFCLQGRKLLMAIFQVIFVPGKAVDFQSSCIAEKNNYDRGMVLGIIAWVIIGISNYFLFNIFIKLLY